ncbi:MAG: hypothetical protein KIT27_04960 [Legionellales bacterium]|nr:hypothetical protein [Legionellales bacterium]
MSFNLIYWVTKTKSTEVITGIFGEYDCYPISHLYEASGFIVMANLMAQQRLISHIISPETIENTLLKITERIKQLGNKSTSTAIHQLELLAKLNE